MGKRQLTEREKNILSPRKKDKSCKGTVCNKAVAVTIPQPTKLKRLVNWLLRKGK